jgi:hypothetical protein
MRTTVAVVVLTIVLLASSNTAADARGSGYATGSPHFVPHYRGAPPVYRAFRRRPLYGGVVGVPFFGSDDYFDYPPLAPYSPDTSPTYSGTAGAAPSTNRCPQPTRKTVTVPAEAGGTQQVTVTYCHP